ncbi:hypothetical protein HZS_7549, partial [Henneguya salminicola]
MIFTFLKSLLGTSEQNNNCVHDYGYLVIFIHEGSPSYMAGIQPYFDFIIKINDVELTHDPNSLLDNLKNVGENPINIYLYSVKTRSYRSITIQKNTNWNGESVLGVNVQYTNILDSEINVWHVLEVYYGSPADVAGLRPYSDYIVASETIFETENSFYELIQNNENKPIKLIVYNSETDATREVIVIPNREWKSDTKTVENNSLLGCGIGYGLLHRIPMPPVSNSTTENKESVSSPLLPDSVPSNQNLPGEYIQTEIQQPYYSNMYPYADPIYPSEYQSQYQPEYYSPQTYQVVPNPYHQYQSNT